jgi:3-hydroxyisobutyrate dehydrogenase-like beta-hydroxyacid dehydrogenase
MTDVSVIGLGAMGSELAECFIKKGRTVTVWNRSAGKAAPLVARGAKGARSVAEAIQASPVTILILLDDNAVQAVLSTPGTMEAARDRTLVNLTTAEPACATATAAAVQAVGGRYLDGGINAYPRQVGLAETVFLYSGDTNAFEQHGELLRDLAGSQQYLGAKPAAAKTVYLALWTYYFAALQGFFEAAALASVGAGMQVPAFRAVVATAMDKLLVDGMDDATKRIAAQRYSGEQATIAVHEDGSRAQLDAFRSLGLNPPVLSAYAQTLQRAQATGRGAQDVAALFEMLRSPG